MCLKINLGSRSKKCLGLQVDKLKCSMIDTDYIIPKPNSACIAVSTVMPGMKEDNLKSLHFAYIHFIVWDNSEFQKKIIQTIACVKKKSPCRKLCRLFNSCQLASEFLCQLLSFLLGNF